MGLHVRNRPLAGYWDDIHLPGYPTPGFRQGRCGTLRESTFVEPGARHE
jgi:hypothetical protein